MVKIVTSERQRKSILSLKQEAEVWTKTQEVFSLLLVFSFLFFLSPPIWNMSTWVSNISENDVSKNFLSRPDVAALFALTLQKHCCRCEHGGRKNDAETNTWEDHLFLYCAFKNLNFCLFLQPFILFFFHCHDTWPSASVCQRSLKGKRKKKEIRNNIYRNVQVSTCFFFFFFKLFRSKETKLGSN